MNQNKVCFKAVTTFPKQYRNLTNSCRAQCGTSQPTQAPNGGMRATASRGTAFFNSKSQARASQLRASGMGPASYVGAPHEGRRNHGVYHVVAKVHLSAAAIFRTPRKCPRRCFSLTLPRFWLRLRRCTSLSLAACNSSCFHLYSSDSSRNCWYACLPSHIMLVVYTFFHLNIHSTLLPALPTVRLLAMALAFRTVMTTYLHSRPFASLVARS